jgi:hypothetical protein
MAKLQKLRGERENVQRSVVTSLRDVLSIDRALLRLPSSLLRALELCMLHLSCLTGRVLLQLVRLSLSCLMGRVL